MNGFRNAVLLSCLLIASQSYAEPKAVSVKPEQAEALSKIGQAMGLAGHQPYKLLSAMEKEYPDMDSESMVDAGELITQGMMNLGVTFSAKEIVIDPNQKFIRGSELPLGSGAPAKATHKLAINGKFLAYVKRPINDAVNAFTPLVGGMAPGWVSAETFAEKTDTSVVPYRMIRYDVIKGGNFPTFCQNAAHIVQWSVDHIEIQTVDTECRETGATTVPAARAEVQAAAAGGKPKFLWVNQGRQVIDLVRIAGDITAVYLRNVSQLYTHNAALGIDVGLSKVLPNAEKSFREGMVTDMKQMGVAVKANEL